MVTEVVVYNIESALNAQRGGADRVELCDNPGGGGTTPSSGTIAVVREVLDISLFVMIRPREGDFCYSDLEFKAMKSDIVRAKELGWCLVSSRPTEPWTGSATGSLFPSLAR